MGPDFGFKIGNVHVEQTGQVKIICFCRYPFIGRQLFGQPGLVAGADILAEVNPTSSNPNLCPWSIICACVIIAFHPLDNDLCGCVIRLFF